MVDYFLTEEQLMIVEIARQIAEYNHKRQLLAGFNPYIGVIIANTI